MSDDLTLQELVTELAADKGPDLRGYKFASLERRVRKRMMEVGASSFRDYLSRVRLDAAESVRLLNTVLINVTEFFRDPLAWQCLRDDGLSLALREVQPGDPLRVWSVGCASGEEPYTLAILLSEFLGSSLADYKVKIYATDIDEEALNIARRGEYPLERLRRLPATLKEKYFTGRGSILRINRDIRRLTIFGRSNIVTDAPISHCNLVICRNLLIYFDSHTQARALSSMQYALEPGGVLFLGKAESQLGNHSVFRPVNTRWRIFQKSASGANGAAGPGNGRNQIPGGRGRELAQNEMESLQLYQRYILETVKSGLLILDDDDMILNHNDALIEVFGLNDKKLTGKRLQNTELAYRCPELSTRLEALRNGSGEAVQFQCTSNSMGQDRVLAVLIRPVTTGSDKRQGLVIYAEDVTARERLQDTVAKLENTGERLQSANEELETTNEELQSTNEELETTNEELQSTNEELETTNEELQSTNEELATTNEELQSLNEELENMNEELGHRTQELHQLSQRYAETLKSMPWPVALVDNEELIQLWNPAAQHAFGVGAGSVVGVGIDSLPVQAEVRSALIRRYRSVLQKAKGSILHTQSLNTRHDLGDFDVHFTPVFNHNREVEGVLIMFGPGSDVSSARPKPPKIVGKKKVPAKAASKTRKTSPKRKK
jgi:two-component system, chemotaxis family, CheB/CheR fusion protein